ncbi:hypothetical protein TEA_005232 [Camellia sinensis var. sinensis]|uniref:protein-serine/threonine phosphatase n=1 Tax=Camellia sinensis var. sinensis TaxID=542762 RepID=A0A4S4DTP5_CAMSN|nr:hypothetical protein TEA_005232 [Camellia sinensis var. sinensis]
MSLAFNDDEGKNGVKEVRIGMVAVFDGHAGAEAGEMASKLLSDYFLLHTNFIQALVRTIHDIDTTFSKEASENNLVSGSTATVVLLVDGHILAAHVGDSKALLCSEKFNTPDEVQGTLLREFKRRRRIGCKDMRLAASNGLTRLSAEELTRDHHPDQVDERLRIEACGGHVDWTYVLRVNGQLAVSSSIGDVKFKRNDSYLVVSSDGIYEKLTVQDVCDLLPYGHSKGYEMLKLFPSCHYPSAECIVKTASEEGSMDNLSAIVVPLKSAGLLSKNLQNRSSNDEAFSLQLCIT